MSVAVNVGHSVNMTLAFLDQNGNPMLTTPAPDAPPVWTDTTPAVGTLTASGSGLTATELALTPGGDTVTVSLSVGGVAFTATVDITVSAVPQVLTSVAIVPTVV